MIKKLKIKFIALSTVALLILLTIIVTGMNILNFMSVVEEADEILELLSNNSGSFPDFNNPDRPLPEFFPGDKRPNHITPELPFESRYFSVLLDKDQNIIFTDLSRIASVSADKAAELAIIASNDNNGRGFTEKFRFYRYSEGDATRIIFLDCGRKLHSYVDFLNSSIIISFLGCLLIFVGLCFFSDRIIKPIAESYEKQKRFITDAGHEIKTPLTVINANTDLIELDIGKNESIDDIRQQTRRLTDLTNHLVYLARMEEGGSSISMTDFPISDIVYEVIDSFSARLKTENKLLSNNITPMLSVKGNSKNVEQLLSILMDNALKYSPEQSEIIVSLSKQGRWIQLSLSNESVYPLDKSELDKIFDRFYRGDPSRNSETGGHGIGLSVARAIVSSHGGRISATIDTSQRFCITVLLPCQ